MKNEARKFIKAIANTITSASLHFDIWWVYKEKDSRAKYVDILNEYLNFFQTSLQAHFLSAVVELYKLFETRNDTISFPRLIKLLNDNSLLDLEVQEKMEGEIKSLKVLWKKVAVLRSELFAHTSIDLSYREVFKKAEISPNNMRDLIERSKKLLNQISKGLERNTYIFNIKATGDTIRVLEDLMSIRS
jgi:hypothetical protein